jgi:hypothetical protein
LLLQLSDLTVRIFYVESGFEFDPGRQTPPIECVRVYLSMC